MAPLGYAKKMSIPVSPSSSGAETNYLVKIALVKGSGTNSAGTGYLGNNCLNWPYDIRFCNNNGDNLSFYRDESDDTDGTWWVKVDSIPTGDPSTIWVYFGKSGDSDASSLDAYIFADDFEGGNLSRWDTADAAWSVVTDRKARGSYAAKAVNNANRVLGKSISPGRSVLFRAFVQSDVLQFAHYFCLPMLPAAGTIYALVNNGSAFKYYIGSYTKLPTATSITLDTWYEIEVALDFENQLFRWWINGVSKGSAALKSGSGATVGTTDYPNEIKLMGDANSGGIYYVDHFSVRPYIYPEPTVGTPGSIENAGGSIVPFIVGQRFRRIT